MNKTRQANYIRVIAMAIATMGVIHIAATFTPLINGGLEVLSSAKQQAMTYMSLMCGMLLIVCGSLVKIRCFFFGQIAFVNVECCLKKVKGDLVCNLIELFWVSAFCEFNEIIPAPLAPIVHTRITQI